MAIQTLPAQAERKPPTLREYLAVAQPEFAKALPTYIKPDRFVRTAQSALTFTRNIDRVRDPQSLLAACMKAAADGLILDGREAALVVDKDGNVQYRPMMRGLLKLAYNSGQIKGIVVEIVCKNDKFRHTPTKLSEPIYHEIEHDEDRGPPTKAYALAELISGGIVHEVMSVADVNRIRDRADAWKAFKAGKIKSTPWSTDWSEMARKTVFRRLSKYIPSSSDRDAFHSAVERIDDDYSHEIEADQPAGDQRQPTATPAPKRRGGAAAALKDVTPQKQQQRQQQAGPDDADDRGGGYTGGYDRDTGEVFDDDYGGDDQTERDDI